LSGLAAIRAAPTRGLGEGFTKLRRPLNEWRLLLTAEAYKVLFTKDTERPNSSPLNNEKHAGTFICAACFLLLFDSITKYK